MKKFNILTIVGTRPELIRLSSIINLLNKSCKHTLVHTGQNYDYELNQIFFEDLDLKKPNFFLNIKKSSTAAAIGSIIIEFDKVLEKVKPAAVLVLGDTNSALSVIAAKKRKIPIFHMEAGNRCYDFRVPEEINRRIVDHIADINLTYSDISREYLLREGIDPDRIIKTGSPMNEVISLNKEKINSSKILKKLKLKKNNYFVVSCHREENIEEDKNFKKLLKLINYLGDYYQIPIIISTHPRTRKKIDNSSVKLNKYIKLIKPLGFSDYNKLQNEAKLVLSDSGTINEESSIQNFRALNIRESFERPEAMEETSVMMVGLEIERVIQGIKILDSQSKGNKRLLRIVSDYNINNVSHKVLRIIISYTDYINRVVWKKY